MRAIKDICHWAGASKDDKSFSIILELADALDRDQTFDINKLFDLNQMGFTLVMELLEDWPRGQYTVPKGKLAESLRLGSDHLG